MSREVEIDHNLSKLDGDTISYFKRVESVIKDDDFDDEEAKQLFLDNVCTQIDGNELALCCHQSMSRVLERLIELFNDKQLKMIWKNLSNNYKTVTTDRFGSHVIQNLVNSIPKAIRIERSEDIKRENADKNTIEQLFISYGSFICDNLEDLIEDVYGSHVVRAVLEVLGGIHIVDSMVQRSRNSRGCRGNAFNMKEKNQQHHKPGQPFGISLKEVIAVPDSFSSVLQDLTVRVLNMDMNTLVFSKLSCPVLQTLLLVHQEKNPKLCGKLCKKMTKLIDSSQPEEDGDDGDNTMKESYQIPAMLTHSVASHLVEKVLLVAPDKQHNKLFEKVFKGHLISLALHPVSNYLVQHLMTSTTDTSQGEVILDELLGEIEEIFSSGHDGVVSRMAELAVRLNIKQAEFQQAILEAFHCTGKHERKKCSSLILCMTTYDVIYGDDSSNEDSTSIGDNKDVLMESKDKESKSTQDLKRINYHGALLLKTLFEFQNPKVFSNSLLKLTKQEMTTVCSDFIGSRTVEAFLKSQSISVEKKNKFFEIMKGEFASLACDKSASHVVESCWKSVCPEHKEQIIKELLKEKIKLTKDFYGRKVLKTCAIQIFDKNVKDIQEKANRKRQIFEETLNSVERKKTKQPEKQTREDDLGKKYARELALLGVDQSDDDNNNDSNKQTKESKKQKKKSKIWHEDDIDVIFKSKKTSKNSK